MRAYGTDITDPAQLQCKQQPGDFALCTVAVAQERDVAGWGPHASYVRGRL